MRYIRILILLYTINCYSQKNEKILAYIDTTYAFGLTLTNHNLLIGNYLGYMQKAYCAMNTLDSNKTLSTAEQKWLRWAILQNRCCEIDIGLTGNESAEDAEFRLFINELTKKSKLYTFYKNEYLKDINGFIAFQKKQLKDGDLKKSGLYFVNETEKLLKDINAFFQYHEGEAYGDLYQNNCTLFENYLTRINDLYWQKISIDAFFTKAQIILKELQKNYSLSNEEIQQAIHNASYRVQQSNPRLVGY